MVKSSEVLVASWVEDAVAISLVLVADVPVVREESEDDSVIPSVG